MAKMRRIRQTVHDGPGAKEQASLEEGVGNEVEHAGGDGTDAEPDEHVAEL